MKKVILFLLTVLALNAQTDLPQKRNSGYEGNHFIVGFMQNENGEIINNKYVFDADLKLYITSRTGANVDYTEGKVTIPPNGSVVIDLPKTYENVDSETLTIKTINITSDNPILVSCYNSRYTTSDIYSALPVNSLGNEYYAVTMPDDFYYMGQNQTFADLLSRNPDEAAPRSGEFLVIATENNTSVEITPACQTFLGKLQNVPFTIIMNKGQAYLVKSYSYLGVDIKGKFDLTGSKIKSDKPIGLVSGHVRTSITQKNSNIGDSKDHICEMLPPTKTWGTRYFSAPFFSGLSDYFKVVSLVPNTNITLTRASGVSQIKLNGTGDFAQEITSEATYWSSDNPVMIAQMMCRLGNIGESNNYDPSMTILAPMDQYIQNINFVTPKNTIGNYAQYVSHSILLVADTKAKKSLSIDGKNISQNYNFVDWGNPMDSVHWIRVQVFPGYHNLKADSGRFSGIIFGAGLADSYSTALGSYLTDSKLVDLTNPQIFPKHNCFTYQGTITDSAKKDMGLGVIEVNKSLTSNFNCIISDYNYGDKIAAYSASPIDYSKDGTFTIDYFDKFGNGQRYQEEFIGVNIQNDTLVDYKSVLYNSISTKQLKIYNLSNKDIVVDSIGLFKDKRLSYVNKTYFPITILSKDSVIFQIKFNPDKSLSDLKDTVIIYSECLTKAVAFNSTVIKPLLIAFDKDYGDVLLGDTVCNSLMWVNGGNVDILITGLTFSKNAFVPDTLGLFPITLAPGDTLKINKVCFIPDSIGYFESNLTANNREGINNLARVTGYGVKPIFNDITIDWQKRRVGTINDTTITITNTGQIFSKINFTKIIKEKNLNNNPDNRDTLMQIKDITLAKDESKSYKLQFYPKYLDTNGYEIQAQFKSNWKLSPDYSISLSGLGTIPQIKTSNVNFDTIRTNQEKIIPNAKIINAGGNEDLTVDTIIPVFGDISSFEIDPIYLKKNVLKLFSEFNIPIKFKPKRQGEHKMLLAIINDAMPKYDRRVDSVWVKGYALDYPISKVDVSFISDSLLACQLSPLYIKVYNDNDIDIQLYKIENQSNGTYFKFDELKYPITIAPKSVYMIKLFVLAERNKEVKFDSKIYFNYLERDYLNNIDLTKDTSVVASVNFYPKANNIKINKQDSIYVYTIGDEMNLEVKGEFPNYTDTLTNFAFTLSYNRLNFYPMQTTTKLVITDGGKEFSFDVDIFKNDSILTFKPQNCNFVVKNDMKWKLQIKFLVLLDTYLNPVFKANASSDICFNPENEIIFTQINKICSFNLRPVEILSNLPFVNISPNPISNFINLKFAIPGDDEVEIYVTNELGETFSLLGKEKYKSGTFSLKLENISLQNGFYILTLKTNFFNMQTNFVIYK